MFPDNKSKWHVNLIGLQQGPSKEAFLTLANLGAVWVGHGCKDKIVSIWRQQRQIEKGMHGTLDPSPTKFFESKQNLINSNFALSFLCSIYYLSQIIQATKLTTTKYQLSTWFVLLESININYLDDKLEKWANLIFLLGILWKCHIVPILKHML